MLLVLFALTLALALGLYGAPFGSAVRLSGWLKLLPLIFLGFSPMPENPLAIELFEVLEVVSVACPDDFNGANQSVCGRTPLAAEAFTRAFDEAASKRLEPLGEWREDHGVWVRTYRATDASDTRYAAVYSTIAEGYNVQLVELE